MKPKHVGLGVLAAIVLLSLAACGGAGSAAGDPLDGTAWDLVAYRSSEPIAGTTITAAFEDGQVSGSAGCNTYFGAYQVDGEVINVGQIAMTEMACLEPAGAMDQELTYLDLLGDARTFQLGDGGLQIFGPDGEALTFVAQ